jgi:phenylalanyl-tRNA synthetase alpha chain
MVNPENLLNEAITLLEQAKTTLAVEKIRLAYLGRKGKINMLAKRLPGLKADQKRTLGQRINQLKQDIDQSISDKIDQLSTAPNLSSESKKESEPNKSVPNQFGHLHLVSQAIEEISLIFEHIGFERVRHPEVDWEWFAFEALNMPANHPARDEWETLYVDQKADPKMGRIVLTPHTSNGQVREMLRQKSTPPIRMINIAKCYRRQQDVTHTLMFHQFEGLCIDKNINIGHLKGTIDYFAKNFYGEKVVSRIRPFHFNFTEPSFEVDFCCSICLGQGCRTCKSGWHEVGGAGMVHPSVLRAGGIDPTKYSGFAFGWGVERTYMMKSGINIADIRTIYDNDIRFLEQF